MHFEKSWVAHTQMKGSLMDVLALVEAAKQLNSETKISKEIATLSVSSADIFCCMNVCVWGVERSLMDVLALV